MSKKMFDLMNGSEVQALCKSFEPVDAMKLDATTVKALRDSCTESGRITVVQGWLDQGGLVELFGIRKAKDGEIPHFFHGVGKDRIGYVGDYNIDNRGWIKANHEKLVGEFMRDRWVHFSPEAWIFSRSGKCKSAQHRGFAAFCRMLADPSYKVGVTLSFGLPDELADCLDRQAQRRNKEIIQIHSGDLLPTSLLVDADGQLYPNAGNVQTTLSGELNGMLRIISLRASGKDVKAGGQFTQQEMGEWLTRYPQAGEVLAQVYRYSLDTSGKPVASVALWRRPLIAAMLTLAANVDNPPEMVVEGKSRKFIMPDNIIPPSEDIVRSFMEVSSGDTATSPFGNIYAKWKLASNKNPQRKAGLLCGAIRQFLANRRQEIVPPAIDEATGQPLPGSVEKVVWTCSQIPFESVDAGAPKGDKETPYKWNSFGGLDVGYLPPIQG